MLGSLVLHYKGKQDVPTFWLLLRLKHPCALLVSCQGDSRIAAVGSDSLLHSTCSLRLR